MDIVKIQVPIYNQLIVASDSPEALLKYMKRTYKGDIDLHSHVEKFLFTTHGACMQLGDDETGESLFLLMAPELSTLCHESIHAAWGVLSYAGVECTSENHEQLAYLSGYIFEEFLKKIDLK